MGRARMRFHDVLYDVKAGSAKEAKKMLDSWDAHYQRNDYVIPDDGGRSAVAKVRLLNLWTLRNTGREQDWKAMPKTKTRRYQLTLKVSESMPSLARSLEMYWDLDDLLEIVITAQGKYAELDPIIRDAFKAAKAKHLKYTKLKAKNAMLFAAHILDPRCKISMITNMMPDQSDAVLGMVKKYMTTEWPSIAEIKTPDLQPLPSAERPDGNPTPQSAPLDWGTTLNNDPDFLRKWWKEHASQWRHLAEAARDFLPCSASEVDVERLFSGCRDEYGIRRHALKAETVRVMTLLLSTYGTEDQADKERIQKAYEFSLGTLQYYVLWHPDQIGGRVEDGKLSFQSSIENGC
ncbi:uncharacterized protein PAC_01332 [Phialocephala subalpina]|uniref:HAT C-terminal dimerisation domain-containing protein n=1 Tax=Phialocephala subalpina TaxID=576137 RepID=A0A1L7WFC2_9HELO|nr:uncharacterized protein PAC_01332 [Phialocephala subalpina]